MKNGSKTLQLQNLSYEDMAGTYKCSVSIGRHGVQNSGSITLDVYCKYYTETYILYDGTSYLPVIIQ